jgi:hypothetical protein
MNGDLSFPISNFHFLVRQGRDQLAGREGVQRPKPPGEFASRQLALAEERPEKIVGAAGTFLRVAVPAAGDEITVRIVARLRARHDVVDTLHPRRELAQTIETTPALPRMDGMAQNFGVKEVLLLEVDPGNGRDCVVGRGLPSEASENLFGQAHFRNMTRRAAFNQTQQAVVDEFAQGLPRRVPGHADTTGQPANGKPKLPLSFQAAMPQKVAIGGVVGGRQAQSRHEFVFQLSPNEFRIRLLTLHCL